ncbi:MAPK regulated corepressor interacting protein 2 isoform X3 [Orcinus orca]|uniref:MAPK regulated corepressor interacting protein 2 isoform X3 n=1 Tax=Orcinus orca TaxID=9733 RepID=UPI002111A664|nr:MAPK regulated corepressor interacting protein 2 isoform X3 [Orcinus orca]
MCVTHFRVLWDPADPESGEGRPAPGSEGLRAAKSVPLSTEEETPAAVGHLSPGWRAGRRDRECLAEWHVQPRTPGSHLLLPGPRLVFNRVNGRRPPATSPSLKGTQETYTLAHEENVRFVSEDFVPIDLDEWWAQQFLARITNCS